MKVPVTILLLLCLSAGASHAEGLRKEAGEAFLEALQKRDSALVADQFRYGLELKGIEEGTPLALPEIKTEADAPLEFLGSWQLDSTRVSRRKESPARYDIRASLTLTAWMGGSYELPDLPVVVGTDTLVFKAPASPLEVKELPLEMETFQPHDIKGQVEFPYTFREIAPWVLGALLAAGLVTLLVRWLIRRRKMAAGALEAEPAHIRALRKLDRYRGDKYWKPEQQKLFYSGVTDTLREYIAARYEVGAMEMTTAEIFDSLKGSDIPEELFRQMQTLFERADFVKFAKFTATDEENARVLPEAIGFVTATYRQEVEEENKEE